MPAKIITVAVKKGGAGKTVTAVNVASLFAKMGFRVLLLDLDEQANAGGAFVIDEDGHQSATLDEVLLGKASIVDAISEVSDLPNLNVSLNGRELERIAASIVQKKHTFGINGITNLLEPIRDAYDFIIIDTAPNFQPLAQAALLAADKIVVPLMDMNGLDGLMDVQNLVAEAQSLIRREIEIRPLFQRANVKALAFRHLKEAVLERGFVPYQIPVPVDESHNKSQIELEPVVLKRKPTKSFAAYLNLVEEIQNA